MKDFLNQLIEKYESRERKERIFILIISLMLIVFIWDFTVRDYVEKQGVQITQKIGQQSELISKLTAQKELLDASQDTNPAAKKKHYLNELKKKMSRAEGELKAMTKGLISAKKMSKVLQEILTRNQSLKVTGLSNIGSQPLTAAEDSDSSKKIYRHSFKLEFEGEYFSTLQYLKALESLSSKVYWGGIQYVVMDYPKARISLLVHTISLNEGWIGT